MVILQSTLAFLTCDVKHPIKIDPKNRQKKAPRCEAFSVGAEDKKRLLRLCFLARFCLFDNGRRDTRWTWQVVRELHRELATT